MSDFALTWNNATGNADMSVSGADYVSDATVNTAVLLSLFTDRAPEPGDVLPNGPTDTRGYWGDSIPVVNGDKFGSRLWLLSRSKLTTDFVNKAKQYAEESLKWLTDDEVVSEIDVQSVIVEGKPKYHSLTVTYSREGSAPVSLQFNDIWNALKGS